MRYKRLIKKVNIMPIFIVIALVVTMGISYAIFNFNEEFFADISNGTTNVTIGYGKEELKKIMSPLSDDDARIGGVSEYKRYSDSTNTNYWSLYPTDNELMLDIDYVNTNDHPIYIGLTVNYKKDFISNFSILNFNRNRIRDNFISFDVKEYDLKTDNYDKNNSKYLIKGQSFDSLDNQTIAYSKVEPGESIHRSFAVNLWVNDSLTICDDGTCSYTSTQFSGLRSDFQFSFDFFNEMDKVDTNTTSALSGLLSIGYTQAYIGAGNYYVEQVYFKKMPKENILNKYNSAQYKVLLDENTYSWLENIDGYYYKCIVASDKKMVPSYNSLSSNIFAGFGNITLIDFGYDVLDLSNVTVLDNFFRDCYSLQTIRGLDRLDLSNVTEMNNLFKNCYSLMHLDFDRNKTIKIVHAENMFYNCASLTSLDLTMFDFSRITNSRYMFGFCKNLINIYYNGTWYSDDVSTNTFTGCENISGRRLYNSLNAGPSYANSTTGYFLKNTSVIDKPFIDDNSIWECVNEFLSYVGNTKLVISSLTDQYSMYGSASTKELIGNTYIWISNIDQTIYVSNIVEKLVVDFDHLNLSINTNIKGVVFGNNVIFSSLHNAFNGLSNVKIIDLGYSDTSLVKDFSGAFSNLNKCMINTYDLDTSNAENMSNLFANNVVETYSSSPNCRGNSNYININYFDTRKVTNMSGMFSGITTTSSLSRERYEEINAYSVTNVSRMFKNHYSVRFDFIFPEIGLKNVDNFEEMFKNFSQINNSGYKFDISKIKYKSNNTINVLHMFENLDFDNINISGFDTSSFSMNPIYYEDVFKIKCEKLIAKNCDFSGLTSGITFNNFKVSYLNDIVNHSIIGDLYEYFDEINQMDLSGIDGLYVYYQNFGHSSFINPDQESINRVIDMDFSHTKFANSISGLFYGYVCLNKLNLYDVDTYAVTDMSGLFFSTGNLDSLDLSSFTYNNCKDLGGMFFGDYINALVVRNLETMGKVENVSFMFCLAEFSMGFHLGDMNTKSVIDFSYMFLSSGFDSQFSIEGFDTSSARYMTGMFMLFGEGSYMDLCLRSFDTRNVTNFDYMFYGCMDISSITVSSSFINNTGSAPYLVFYDCLNLAAYYNNGWYETNRNLSEYGEEDTADHFMIATDSNDGMLTFDGLSIDNIYNVLTNGNSYYVIHNAMPNITKIVIDVIDSDDFSNLTGYICLSDDNVAVFVENNVLYIYGCKDESEYHTKITLPENCSSFFADLSNLETIEGLEHLDFNLVTNMSGFFKNCRNLREIHFSDRIEALNVTNMSNMFESCEELLYADLEGLVVPNVTNVSNMFSQCYLLKAVDITNMSGSHLTSTNHWFYECYVLEKVFVNDNWSIPSLSSQTNTFVLCNLLNSISYDGDVYNWDSTKEGGEYAKVGTKTSGGFFSNDINYMIKFDEILDNNFNPVNYSVLSFTRTKRTDSQMYDGSLMHDGSILISVNGNTVYVYSSKNIYLPENCDDLFSGWTALNRIEWSDISNSRYTTSMNGMFAGCSNLSYAHALDGIDTRNCTDVGYMLSGTGFSGTFTDASNFDLSKVNSVEGIFAECRNMTSIVITGWSVNHDINFDKAFYKCSNLLNVVVGLDFDTNHISSALGTFSEVSSSYKARYAQNSSSYYTISSIYSGYASAGETFDWAPYMKPCTLSSRGMLEYKSIDFGYSF